MSRISSVNHSSLPELTNVQLDHHFGNNPYYVGTYAKNQLPSEEKLKGRFIITNLQSSDAGHGTHWTLLYNVNPKTVIYFDPIGEIPPQSIHNLMEKTGKSTQVNAYDLQPLGTSSCGWWCIYVAQRLLSGKSLDSIVHEFSMNPSRNESLLKSHFQHRPRL